jgi:integrase
MHPKVREAFLEILTDNPEIGQEEPIIQTKLGRHRDARAIQRAFDKARQYAALSEEPRSLRFHDLRHTMISRLANQPGARMPWVQKQARHSDMATTLKYVHEIEDEEYVAAAWEKA